MLHIDLKEFESVGGVGIELIALIYVFYSFYIVTDHCFVPAISKLCNKLHIPDDVAGATILGAEIFSNAIGLYILDSPVGVGLIMGSFNFNILMITGFTALAGRESLRSRQLTIEWRYLQRDAFVYLVSLGLLLWSTHDGMLTSVECGVMLGAYCAYVALCGATGVLARMFCAESRKPRRSWPLQSVLSDVLGPELVEKLIKAHSQSEYAEDSFMQRGYSGWRCCMDDDRRLGCHCTTCSSLVTTEQQQEVAYALNALIDFGWEALREHRCVSDRSKQTDEASNKHTGTNQRSASVPNLREAFKARATWSATVGEDHVRPSFFLCVDSLQKSSTDTRSTFHSAHERPNSSCQLEPLHGEVEKIEVVVESAPDDLSKSAPTQQILAPNAEQWAEPEMLLFDETLLHRLVGGDLKHLLGVDSRLLASAVDLAAEQPFAPDVLERAHHVMLSRESYADGGQMWQGDKPRKSKAGQEALLQTDSEDNKVSWIAKGWEMTVHGPLSRAGVLARLAVWTSRRWQLVAGLCSRLRVPAGVFHLDEQLLGETIVAAATSAPNVFAAIAAGQKGQVDSATSQAFGSNVFDILIAFNLPYAFKVWFTGQPVAVSAGGVTRDSIVDVAILVGFLILLVTSRFRLTRAVGICCIAGYLSWVIYAIVAFRLTGD